MLVAESWRNDSAGGNVTENHFSGMNAEFAQIFTSGDLPKNSTCFKYYQITDSEVVKKFFTQKPVGKILDIDNLSYENVQIEETDRKFMDFFRKFRWNVFLFLKSYIWRYANWKTPALEQFILDFSPDIIFAPCYAFPFQLALTRYVKELTGKKIVSYSSDDNYSLKQFSLSPFYWINRFWNRACLRKTYPYYDLIYSMTEAEVLEMSPIINKPMRILQKGFEIKAFKSREVHDPIRIIYAGGVYIERWKVLAEIGKILKEINVNGVKMVLNIYTQNSLTNFQLKSLNDGENIFVHRSVSKEELEKLYQDSDIALHVESFTLRNKLTTRLSFSTKIIDCLASGCAVVAIAWQHQGGLKYLKEQDAAICITDFKAIKSNFQNIINDKNIIDIYAKKAYNCGARNHDIKKIRKDLYDSLVALS
jgi:hypothetical protein